MTSKKTSSKAASRKANGSNKHEATALSKSAATRNRDSKNGASAADAKMLRAWETISKNRGEEPKGARG